VERDVERSEGTDVARQTRSADPEAADGATAAGPTDPHPHQDADRTGLVGAPDPQVDDSDQAAARDDAASDTDVEQRTDPGGDRAIPRGVQVATAWAWRFVVLAVAAYVLLQVISRINVVLVPVAIAVLISALLQPLAATLAKRGLPPAVATLLVLIGGLIGIGLLVWLVVSQFRSGWGDLSSQVSGGVDKVKDWLITGPLGLSQSQIDDYVQSARDAVSQNREALTSGALGAASTAGHVLTGVLLVIFSTIFLVKDGRRIWLWIVNLFPRGSRNRVDGAGLRGWHTLISYVRATLAVAFVDAVGIGIGAAVLGVPLALPLAVIVFIGAFIPIVGALISGLVAVLVALVAKGPVTALLLLLVVLLVQQIEGHVLQPFLLGRAVKVHPLAVVLAIATGSLLAGIIGALVAVPIVAVANSMAAYLSRDGRSLVPTEPSDGGTPAPTG
jgi:predicted PurR-regulated permease PerM